MDNGIGGIKSNVIEGTGRKARRLVEWQGKILVTHWELHTSRQVVNIWILEPEVISKNGYVKIRLLFRERLRLWD